MAFSKISAAQAVGLRVFPVDVETDISGGLHAFTIVGLPDKAVEEARDRVGSAIKNAGFPSPKHHNRKVVVSLAPGDLKKEGPLFDLAIAISYLHAIEEVAFDPSEKLFLGELSLDGNLRPVPGMLLFAQHARELGFAELFVPYETAEEAAYVSGITVYGVRTLADLVAHLNGETLLEPFPHKTPQKEPEETRAEDIDFSDIRGQEGAKRACEIAAAGRHNVAFYGPPGSGKTMLAKALRGILPRLSEEEALEVTGIHSLSGTTDGAFSDTAPFRAPHHTSSYVSIAGGGTIPKPGEATLAHRGVLFLDEFPEFDRRVIEALRQPLEDGTVSITRAQGNETFPAEFILVAAMNPCPCGYYGSDRACTCTPGALHRYQRKVSGPIVDRIDMWIYISPVAHESLSVHNTEEKKTSESADIRGRIASAREKQQTRFKDNRRTNRDMGAREIENEAQLSQAAEDALRNYAKSLDLSARSYHRTIKLARTIADLANSDTIEQTHVLEALQYRPKNEQS